MPERSDYKSGRPGGYNGGFGGNALRRQRRMATAAAGGPLGAYVPPHSIEAEQSTLGAMLIERSAVEKVFEILDKEDFYREAHQTLFDVITFLAERDEPIDLITVQNELKNRDKLDAIGGMAYLAALFDTVPTAANVEYYAKIVEEKATLRRLISASLEIIGTARGEVEDVGEVLDEAERVHLQRLPAARHRLFLPPAHPAALSLRQSRRAERDEVARSPASPRASTTST